MSPEEDREKNIIIPWWLRAILLFILMLLATYGAQVLTGGG